MASLFNFIVEKKRQIKTGDSDFYENWLMFFELEIPKSLAVALASNKFLFPFVINPESYKLSEPFSLELTPTDGATYTEENGILHRTISLSGTTGFKPRRLRGSALPLLAAADVSTYSRALPWVALDKISGHWQFLYLQDVIFRTYADLKNDPATSEETFLYFHIPKDQEHWLVKPRSFELDRNAGDGPLYRYSIELLAVDKAEVVDEFFSEDKNLLDKLKAALRMVKSGFDMIAGAIQDITGLVNEIRQFISKIATIIDNVTNILEAAGDFLDGVTDLIETPYAFVESTIRQIEEGLAVVASAEAIGTAVRTFPETVRTKMRTLEDGLERLATQPQVFESTSQRKMREIKERQEVAQSVSNATLAEAAASSPPTSFLDVGQLGTALTPGDVQEAEAELGVGNEVRNYSSAQSIPIGQGDTLTNLAARYLGDARRWQDIAVVNGLKPPFLTQQADAPLGVEETGSSQALNVGDSVLIPNYSRPPAKMPLLPVLGVPPDRPVEEQVLGTTFLLEVVGGRPGSPLYDIPIDVEGGSQSGRLVSGVACLSQGILDRLSIEKGTDVLYKRLGTERIVGKTNAGADLEMAQFRARQSVTQDARVAQVQRMQLTPEEDKVEIDIDVGVRGFAEPLTLSTALK
jgi:hypothetical protein